MPKAITYTTVAARALRRHAAHAVLMRQKIEQYATDPASLTANVKVLKGVDAKRLRVGDFRVIFRETPTAIEILDIGPRSSIYD
jgi:mRNA interferase RelE/StbE